MLKAFSIRKSFQTWKEKPGKSFKFPVRIEYGKKRSFNPSWLDNHNWLVYSPAKDGAYCKFCVLFGTTTEQNSSTIDHLVKSPNILDDSM